MICFRLLPRPRQRTIQPTRSTKGIPLKKGNGATSMIRSSLWQALSAAVVVGAFCLAPGTRVESIGRGSVTAASDQSPVGCRTDCTIEKQSLVTLSGVDTTKTGARVVRDSRGRFVAVSDDLRQLLVFGASGQLLPSPRPSFGRIVSLFVDSRGAVRAFDTRSGSLLTFDANYRVVTQAILPHSPSLPLSDGRFLVASQIATPAMVGHPFHVMSKDGSIERSFGGDGGPVHLEETLRNGRVVCLNPDGTVWSIAPGGRLLERWDTSTGHRVAQVTVKSTWFHESSRPAPQGQVANPIILTIWAEKELLWILYRAPDPQWIPGPRPEQELTATGENASRRSDWVLEAVRTETGSVVAMKRFDRILLRRNGSFAVASDAASGGVELWMPIVVKKKSRSS